MNIRQILAQNVKRLLDEQGISQKVCGERGGITQASVSLVVRGERDCRLHTLEGIARGLGVTPESLIVPRQRGSAEYRELADLYSQLPDESRKEVLRFVRREIALKRLQ